MITTADLIDICSLYYTQEAIWLDVHSPSKFCGLKASYSEMRKRSCRAYLYLLSVRLILEGVY